MFAEDGHQVPWATDEQAVEAFAADCANPSFGIGVGPWCLPRRLDYRIPSAARTASKAALNVASRSRIGYRNWGEHVARRKLGVIAVNAVRGGRRLRIELLGQVRAWRWSSCCR